MSITTRVAEKTGVIGIVVGSFGCAACFPATASIGTAVGLGFLGAWEGLFVRILIPIFALVALLANLTGWFSHRAWYRTLAGSIGPVMVLVGAFGLMGVFGLTRGFLAVNVARGMFYAGLIVMVFAALSDLVRPANRHCRTDDAKTPGERSRKAMNTHRNQPHTSNIIRADQSGARRADCMHETAQAASPLVLDSTITCPSCGSATRVHMATDACQFFWECPSCGTLLRPKRGDCCVFCSWGDVPCPPTQMRNNGCR